MNATKSFFSITKRNPASGKRGELFLARLSPIKWTDDFEAALKFESYAAAQLVVSAAEEKHFSSPGYSAGRGHANGLGWYVHETQGVANPKRHEYGDGNAWMDASGDIHDSE